MNEQTVDPDQNVWDYLDGDTIIVDEETDEETGAVRLLITPPPEPEGENERKANRKERRDYIRAQTRGLRLAYGFGKVDRIPPGVFVRPAAPR